MANRPKGSRVPVSTRALIQRINRKLGVVDQVLKATRGGRAERDLGHYYVLDLKRNTISAQSIDDLEKLGREVGALKRHERWHVEEP